MNEYRFIFQSFVTIVKASTLAQAYQILEREGAVKEQTLLNVECKRSTGFDQLLKSPALQAVADPSAA